MNILQIFIIMLLISMSRSFKNETNHNEYVNNDENKFILLYFIFNYDFNLI